MTELLTGPLLAGTRATPDLDPFLVVRADDHATVAAYRALRRAVFVDEQGLFSGSDADSVDDDPRTTVLVARAPDGEVLGGVRVHPSHHPAALAAGAEHRDLGWWSGSRLVVAPDARTHLGVGAALVRAACAAAEQAGALRFDATVQAQNAVLFRRLGWSVGDALELHGHPHVRVDWPVARVQRLVEQTKADLGGLLAGVPHDLSVGAAAPGYTGDDGAPVPGTDVVAACDAILPAMVERDPEWAGWCAVLVNLNDLAAMGAVPTGLLDALGARDASFARRVLRGLVDGARAWGVPVLGGHTQLGVPASLSVTALGRVDAAAGRRPVPGGGGRPGDTLRLTADLGGGWRHGYAGRQWDSTSHRTPTELRAQGRVVVDLDPAAAKDVSMSGVVGTTGMLAEASGCRAVLDVASVPQPAVAAAGDWLTCFPGFAMVTAHRPGVADRSGALPATVESAPCGELVPGAGVSLRWPDGTTTDAVTGPVTGQGTA
ncbi:MAG: AIR synthase [Nocardioides sp.]|nr:AIR synthase [Nocardioides sp.]